MDFLYANSIFAVQNEGTYLPRITRETCNRWKCLTRSQLTEISYKTELVQIYHVPMDEFHVGKTQCRPCLIEQPPSQCHQKDRPSCCCCYCCCNKTMAATAHTFFTWGQQQCGKKMWDRKGRPFHLNLKTLRELIHKQQYQILKNDSWYDSKGLIVVAGVMAGIMMSLLLLLTMTLLFLLITFHIYCKRSRSVL